MKKGLTGIFVFLLLGLACQAADGEFRYTLLVNGQGVKDSLFVFGRSSDATNGIDDLDFPAVPNCDGGKEGAPVDDLYFRSQPSPEMNNNAGNAFSKLYTDLRSATTNATTWTICTYDNNVALSWEGKYYDVDTRTVVDSALGGDGTLEICDSEGNVIVADMRETTSCNLAAKSVYNIKYTSGETVSVAPETPEELSKKFALMDAGGVSKFKILDVTKYTLVDWTLNFFNGTERLAGKTIKMSDGKDYASYNAETGVFSFTQPADFGATFTEFRLDYSFKYLNFTRAGEDGVAIGTLRAVRTSTPIMELDDECRELTVKANSADVDDKTVSVSFNFMVDKDYQKTMTENLVLVGEIALPQWTYMKGSLEDCPWRGSIVSKGAALDENSDFNVVDSIESGARKDGDVITTSLVFTAEHPLMTITPTESLGNFTATLTLVGSDRCASGTVTFTGSFVDVDGDTVTLPGAEEASDALTATITVEKSFMALNGSVTVNDWEDGTSVATEADTFTYTDGNGGAYAAGGAITAIDVDEIELYVDGTEVDYDAVTFGGFAVSDGRIVWDGQADLASVAHKPLLFTVPFTAKASDADCFSSGEYVLLVFPADNEPYIVDFSIGSLVENELVSFSFKIVDPDGDDPVAYDDTVTLNGKNIAGVFSYSNEDFLWTFTSNDVLSYDTVAHTVTDKNSHGVFVIPWTISFQISDVIERIDVVQSSGDDKDAWIEDVDREQGTPAIVKYSPAAPTTSSDITVEYTTTTDADGDEISYTVQWTCDEKLYIGETLPASQTAKGDIWTATVIATTRPYGDDFSTSAMGVEVTIGNTKPEIAGNASITIHKEAGQAEAKGSIEFTITDPDAADELTVVLGDTDKGSVEASEVMDGKFTVTYFVHDLETAFDSDTFTVKVNDGDDDSNEISVTVAFIENKPPAVVPVGDSEMTIDEVDAEGNPTAVTLKIQATDSTEVSPYGIKSIAWTVSEGDGIVIASEATKTNSANADGNYPVADEMEVTVTTKGYESLNGPDRPSAAAYTVKVDVTDGVGTVTSYEFVVTVNDVDRAPSTPDDIEDEYEGGNKTGAVIYVCAKGSVDPDGDAVCYVYSLYIDGELVEGPSEPFEDGEEVQTETLLVKGQKPEIRAKAVSKPAYEGAVELSSEEYTTGELAEVENTVPVLTTPEGGEGEIAIDEYVAGYNEAEVTLTLNSDDDALIIVFDTGNDNESEVGGGEEENDAEEGGTIIDFAYKDIDEAAGADHVTVTINGEGLAGYATVAIVEGKIVIIREANKNTVGLEGEERPFFTLTATDESGESVDAKFYVTFNPINEKPVVAERKIGITSEILEGQQEFEVTFGASADEATQIIAGILDIELVDESNIIAEYALTPSEDNKKVILTYKGCDNIDELSDKEATLTFKVKDNGGTPYDDTSDVVTVTFIAGKTFHRLTFLGKIYDGIEAGEEMRLIVLPGVIEGTKFDTWVINGLEIEEEKLGFPIIDFLMPHCDVDADAIFTELGFEEPVEFTVNEYNYSAMVCFGSVVLPSGYVVNDDATLVGIFDDEGVCYGVGAPNAYISAKFGCSVYYLTVFEGVQKEGLSLKFWNLLTNEMIDINGKLDFEAGEIVGMEEPLQWTTSFNFNDSRNPQSNYYNPRIYGEDMEGTEFSMFIGASWENSPISFDFKLSLHNSATADYDEDYDTMQPEIEPPAYDEYACLISADDVPLQLDARPAEGRHVQWTMRVVVPEGKPVTISWDESSIPDGWEATLTPIEEVDGFYEGEVSHMQHELLKMSKFEVMNVSDTNDDGHRELTINEPGTWYLVFDFFDSTGLEKFTYNLVPGWNLITPTMNLIDESIDELLDLGIYVLDEESNVYVKATHSDIVPGKALWIFHHGESELDVWGTPVDGWELQIGNNLSLVGVLEDIPAEARPEGISVWEWIAGGYHSVEGGLEAGKAYWMCVAAQ